jgi:hypothetical protein
MALVPNYANPIFGLEHAAEELQDVMSWPVWERRKWLRTAKRLGDSLIYRYQDFNPSNQLSMRKAEDLLTESRLYLASPNSFNDPYEFQARIVVSADAVKRRAHFEKVAKRVGLKGKERARRLAEFMRKSNADGGEVGKLLEQTRSRWGIACFCLDPRQLRMWSHYAGAHTGICFQFDLAADVGFAAQLLPVNYQPEIATLHWPEDQHRVVDDVLLRKWDVWAEEVEVRYTSHTVVNSHLPIAPGFVTGLILGNRFPDSSMPALNEFLRRRRYRGLRRLRLFRADRYADRYGMYVRRLNAAERALLPHA